MTDNTPMAYNTKAAAAELGVSYSSVRRLIADGHLRAARVGSLVMIPRAELERFLETASTSARS